MGAGPLGSMEARHTLGPVLAQARCQLRLPPFRCGSSGYVILKPESEVDVVLHAGQNGRSQSID